MVRCPDPEGFTLDTVTVTPVAFAGTKVPENVRPATWRVSVSPLFSDEPDGPTMYGWAGVGVVPALAIPIAATPPPTTTAATAAARPIRLYFKGFSYGFKRPDAASGTYNGRGQLDVAVKSDKIGHLFSQ